MASAQLPEAWRAWLEAVGRADLSGLPGREAWERSAAVARGVALVASLPRPPVGASAHVVVHRQNKLKLRYYAPVGGAAASVPVVVVPSLINRAWICDLEPERSLVGALSAAGHPTFLVDWGEPGPEDAGLTVGTVVLDLLHRAIDRACRHVAAPAAHVLGYCQGGTLAAMYTALRPGRVASLVALNAPVKFAHAGRFRDLVHPDSFDVHAAIDRDGMLPLATMQAAFRLLDPMGSLDRYAAVTRAAAHPAQLARVLARERWLEENVPMPGRFAAEFIRCAYQEDRLVAGTWELGGERIDLGAIRCPVQVFAAARDFIAPAASVAPLAELVGSEIARYELLLTGHIGVVVGSYGPREFYPRLDRWFRGLGLGQDAQPGGPAPHTSRPHHP